MRTATLRAMRTVLVVCVTGSVVVRSAVAPSTGPRVVWVERTASAPNVMTALVCQPAGQAIVYVFSASAPRAYRGIAVADLSAAKSGTYRTTPFTGALGHHVDLPGSPLKVIWGAFGTGGSLVGKHATIASGELTLNAVDGPRRPSGRRRQGACN